MGKVDVMVSVKEEERSRTPDLGVRRNVSPLRKRDTSAERGWQKGGGARR